MKIHDCELECVYCEKVFEVTESYFKCPHCKCPQPACSACTGNPDCKSCVNQEGALFEPLPFFDLSKDYKG